MAAKCGNKIGWFPSNYTQEELEDAHTYCMAENVLDIMVALYDFKAQNDTELSFAKAIREKVRGPIAIAKFTHSGSQVVDWSPEGSMAKSRNL